MEHKVSTSVYDEFLLYRAQVIRAVALAWQDDGFKAALRENPRAAVRQYLNYEIPFALEIDVIFDNAEFCPQTLLDWLVKKTDRLQLNLPPAPPANQQAEALAAYNLQFLTFLQPHTR